MVEVVTGKRVLVSVTLGADVVLLARRRPCTLASKDSLILTLVLLWVATVLLIGVQGVSDLRVVGGPAFEEVCSGLKGCTLTGGLRRTVLTVTFRGSSMGFVVGFTAFLLDVDLDPKGTGGTYLESNS